MSVRRRKKQNSFFLLLKRKWRTLQEWQLTPLYSTNLNPQRKKMCVINCKKANFFCTNDFEAQVHFLTKKKIVAFMQLPHKGKDTYYPNFSRSRKIITLSPPPSPPITPHQHHLDYTLLRAYAHHSQVVPSPVLTPMPFQYVFLLKPLRRYCVVTKGVASKNKKKKKNRGRRSPFFC